MQINPRSMEDAKMIILANKSNVNIVVKEIKSREKKVDMNVLQNSNPVYINNCNRNIDNFLYFYILIWYFIVKIDYK